MPEEEMPLQKDAAAETATEPPPEETVEEKEAESQTGEAEAAAEDTKDARFWWSEALPELADMYDKLTPDVRERLLAKRLAGLPAKSGTEADTEDEGKATSSTTTARAEPPATPEVPPLDVDKLKADIVSAMEEDDHPALAGAVVKGVDYINGMARIVAGALVEVRSRIDEMENRSRWNSELEDMLPKISGATPADIGPAAKLLGTKKVTDRGLALRYAMHERVAAEQRAKRGRQASPESKQKGAALKAQHAAGLGGSGGVAPLRRPRTPDEYAAVMEQEAKIRGK